MTPEAFAYWLQGFFELSQSNQLSETQVQVIRDHLQLVFNKQTPDRKFTLAPLVEMFERDHTGTPKFCQRDTTGVPMDLACTCCEDVAGFMDLSGFGAKLC